jgi:predicted phosphodiesterase
MRYAIVSDIHANRQAWEETLNDILRQKVDATICLGDIIGYGPMPEPVLESVCEYVDDIVIGNHDAAISGRFAPEYFGERALRSLEWTRGKLHEDAVHFLGELPSLIEGEGFALVHAEALDPEVFGYIENPTDARLNLECNDYPLIFVGHTHVPDIYALGRHDHTVQRIPPRNFTIDPQCRYVVNVGSVGDPRDGTSEASYCIFDDETGQIVFRRLSFDLDAYLRDMADSGLHDTPYFIEAASQPGILPAAGDWAMEMAPREAKPARQPVRVAHVSQSEGWMDEVQEAAAERERIKRQQISQALRQARLEDEQRRQAQAEAMRNALRQRQRAAEQQRLAAEEEQRRLEEEARLRDEETRRQSLELLLTTREREEERKRERAAQAILLRQALREKQEAARRQAEIRRRAEEREREERERRLQQRKLELARAATERQRKRREKREAAAAEMREILERKRKTADGAAPAEEPEAPPPAEPAAARSQTREIILPKMVLKPAPPPAPPPAAPEPVPRDRPPAAEEDPAERRRAIARAAAEKQQLRRQEELLRKEKVREAIRRKQEAARRQQG